MSYFHTAPGLTYGGCLYSEQVQPHVFDMGEYPCLLGKHVGVLDAPEFLPAGSCINRRVGSVEFPSQSKVERSLLDAYEYTDATAKHTDCASEAV